MRATLSGRQFAVLAALVVVAGFAGGAASNALLAPRSAEAQLPSETHVMVPEQGIAFRNNQGKIVARIASDPNGGRLDLYDAHEQPGVSLGSRSSGGGTIALYSEDGAGRSINGAPTLDTSGTYQEGTGLSIGRGDPFAAARSKHSVHIAAAVPGR